MMPPRFFATKRKHVYFYAKFLFVPSWRAYFYAYVSLLLMLQWPQPFDFGTGVYVAPTPTALLLRNSDPLPTRRPTNALAMRRRPRPPSATRHPPPATRHPPPATR